MTGVQTCALPIFLAGAAALVPLGWVKVKMLPFDNKSEFQVMIDLPEGTALETTARAASMLAARFWPGPLTLVLPGGERRVPAPLRGPEGGIAVRWTPHPAMQRLIAAYGDAITSTSANQPGEPPATEAAQIVAHWAGMVASGQLRVLDAGTLPPSAPSTVVDCTGRYPRVIRPGAVSAAALREAAPELLGDQ